MLSKKLLNYTFSILFTLIISIPIYASTQSLKIEYIEDKPSLASRSASSSSSSTPMMPFKLGFEFQEATGLCSWAQHDSRIQKKKLFELADISTSNILWHMVIDSSDIEFVTEPYSHNDKESLAICMQTIYDTTAILKKLLNADKESTFENFVKKIEEHIHKTPIRLKLFETYYLVNNKPLSIKHVSLNEEWSPSFVPQATIQHPLEYTIPLYFSLFGFDNEYMPRFSASLPLKNQFLEAQRDGDGERLKNIITQLKTKFNGLVFLQALTMTCMAPVDYPDIYKYVNVNEFPEVLELIKRTSSLDLGSCSTSLGKVGEYVDATQKEDTKQLSETLSAFNKYDQVDPKLSLIIMSRRPFSLMYQEILEVTSTFEKYADYFRRVMGQNLSFYDVPRLFNKVNYAEQFFDPEHGNPRDLSFLLESFKDSFMQRNLEQLKTLLIKGIVSTTMIRNFKENITVMKTPVSLFFENYFNFSLVSVDKPQGSIKLNLDSSNIESIIVLTKWNHDLLSPPPLLEESNSMGRYNKKMTSTEKQFGEAIVEIRAIRSVQPWFLRKCNIDQKLAGKFLSKPESIISHSQALFTFLSIFGSGNFDYDIFETGLSHALRQYS